MSESVCTHSRGRSAEREAAVIVRMSQAERDALRQAAAERGETMSGLILAGVADLIGAEA